MHSLIKVWSIDCSGGHRTTSGFCPYLNTVRPRGWASPTYLFFTGDQLSLIAPFAVIGYVGTEVLL